MVYAVVLIVGLVSFILAVLIDMQPTKYDNNGKCPVCDSQEVYPYSPACSVGCSIAMGR